MFLEKIMSTLFFGDWTDDEKVKILLKEDEIEKNMYDPAMQMTDKDHHDFMVSHLSRLNIYLIYI